MTDKDFSIAITLEASPDAVFSAINNVRGWWSGDIEGETDRLGAEFTYRYKDVHWSRQQITEMQPGRRIVWHVADARLNFVRDGLEWNGTDIVFDIAPAGNGTALRFTHRGLLPGAECYDSCSGAWSFYIGESLRSLVTTGRGEPNETEPAASA